MSDPDLRALSRGTGPRDRSGGQTEAGTAPGSVPIGVSQCEKRFRATSTSWW